MDIFVLDKNPKLAAQAHYDTHVSKMCLETAQILSTVARRCVPASICNEQGLYKPTHSNHPSVLWAGKTYGNFLWTLKLFDELLNEFEYRFGHHHDSSCIYTSFVDTSGISERIKTRLNNDLTQTPPALAMETRYYRDKQNKPWVVGVSPHENLSAVNSYRHLYVTGKKHLQRYTRREYPNWFEKYRNEAFYKPPTLAINPSSFNGGLYGTIE